MGEAAQYAPGQQLAGTVYRVVRHLATGGMGSVYDVEDVTVGKRYVLKTLHPQLVSRHDLAKRMQAEARALATLQHPNIVDVVTAGVTTDDQPMPFYVMERLNGQNLRIVIEKKGSLELAHCYRIAIDVLDALEHAHEHSVLHRDVKPDNIFLHRNANGTTTTKLLDFGIMRLLDRKASHTQGKFIGTLRYASPEQIFGGDLGPASDIYSLGLVLYEMVAGRGPFDELGDAYAIGAAHAQMPPPPISRFVAVPQTLERLVMASIAKPPDQRPRDCFAFASELRRLLRDEEAAPKSATAVNVLTSGPDARPSADMPLPLAGTELSPPPEPPAPPADPTATAVGMPAPSLGPTPNTAAGGMLPPTVRHGASGVAPPVQASGAASVTSATGLGVAATLASHPGFDALRAPPERAGSVPGQKPLVDRGAETRASSGAGATQRLGHYGTAIDGLPAPSPEQRSTSEEPAGFPLLPDDAVRAALAQREPLEVPPTSGPAHDARSQELVFPRTHGHTTGTGPLAGEAQTRPPERSMILPLLAAAAVGAALVGGAVLFVTKPWQQKPASAARTGEGTPPPSVSPIVVAPAPAVPSTGSVPVAPTVAPGVAPATASAVPVAPAGTRPVARPVVASPAPPASSTGRKPPRPPSAAPRPEDVGFE